VLNFQPGLVRSFADFSSYLPKERNLIEASIIGLSDSLLENGKPTSSTKSIGQLEENRKDRVNKCVTSRGMFRRLAFPNFGCPEIRQHQANVGESQIATREKPDRKSCWNKIDEDIRHQLFIPDAVTTKNSVQECLRVSERARWGKNASEVAILESMCNGYSIADNLSFPQSSPASSILSETEASISPGSTLVEEDTFSLASTLENSSLLESKSIGSTASVESDLFGRKPYIYTSPAPQHANVSVESVLGGKREYKPQKIENLFTDSTEYYYHAFGTKLQALNSKNSEGSLRIESFLEQSEAEWFERVRRLKLGKSNASTPSLPAYSPKMYHPISSRHVGSSDIENPNLLVQDGHRTLRGLRRVLVLKIGDWPVYSLSIALVRNIKLVEISC
jgi:hypothetical protein